MTVVTLDSADLVQSVITGTIPVPKGIAEDNAALLRQLEATQRENYDVTEHLRKELLQIAQAARHRFAPRIDDPRVGKHQVDQADMAKIIRHLVDETRLAGAVDLRIAKIFFGKNGKGFLG